MHLSNMNRFKFPLVSVNHSEPCPICAHSSSNSISSTLRRGEGIVYYCDHCDHAFLNSAPNTDLEYYYKTSYRNEYSHLATKSQTNSVELFEIYKRFQSDRLNIISKYLNDNVSLLEVGASAGQFLVHAKEYTSKLAAIELDSACAKFINCSLNIDSDDALLENSKFSNQKFDIVCSFQVMEHVESPFNFLSTLINSCAPGGKIFIEVPNLYDSLNTIWDCSSYSDFFYHSAHLHYFSRSSLEFMLKQCDSLFKSTKFHFLQDYNLLNHLNWLTNKRPQDSCIPGLSDIYLPSTTNSISSWLEEQLIHINSLYKTKLAENELTSNILVEITLN